MASEIRRHTWVLKYTVLPLDLTDLQTWIYNTIECGRNGAFGAAALKGLQVIPFSGLTVRALIGIGVNDGGRLMVVDVNQDVAVASPVGNPAKSLIVLRPKDTDGTSKTDPITLLPFTFDTIQDFEVVVIDGTPAPTPLYPATVAGDIKLMGVVLTAGHVTIVAGDLDPGQRETPRQHEKTVFTHLVTATLAVDAELVEADAAAGVMTLTLPLARDHIGKKLTVTKVDSGGNAVTIDGDGSETISGQASIELTDQWMVATMYSNGTNWRQI